MRQRVEYEEVEHGRRRLVPVRYVSDGKNTLVTKRTARRLYKAGTVTLLGAADWVTIQAKKGAGLNVDPAFLRTGG